MRMNSKPAMISVLGNLSNFPAMKDPQAMELYFNPADTFREVHLVSLGDVFDPKLKESRIGNIYVHPIRSLTTKSSLRLINNLYLIVLGIFLIRMLTKRHRIDLIAQVFATPLKYGIPAVIVARISCLPSIITLCNDYQALGQRYSFIVRWISKFLWRYMFSNCTRVRSKSDYIAEFAYDYGVPLKKLDVIPNKIPLQEFRVAPNDQEAAKFAEEIGISVLINGSIVCLSVARLIEVKNYERQLEAFAKACRRIPNLVYLILGEGPLQNLLEDLIDELGITDRVRLLGHLPHDQLRFIYHLSDFLLFATLYEGQPRVVIEGMSAGLPIICANYGEVCNLVANERNGSWINPLSVSEICDAVIRMSDSGIRAEMSISGDHDADRFSMERVGAQESVFYLKAISEEVAD